MELSRLEGKGKATGPRTVDLKCSRRPAHRVVIHVGGRDRVHRFAESQHDSLGFARYGDDFRRDRGIRRQDSQLQRPQAVTLGERSMGVMVKLTSTSPGLGAPERIGIVTAAPLWPLANVTV